MPAKDNDPLEIGDRKFILHASNANIPANRPGPAKNQHTLASPIGNLITYPLNYSSTKP